MMLDRYVAKLADRLYPKNAFGDHSARVGMEALAAQLRAEKYHIVKVAKVLDADGQIIQIDHELT